MKLKNGTWVAACDGGKFLLLQNRGDAEIMDLRVIAHEQIDPTVQSGRQDRGPSPDGTQARLGRSHSQSVEDHFELKFVQSIAAELSERVRTGAIAEMVLIADPKTLGLLRRQLSDQTQEAIAQEIGGDFAHNTVAEVEAVLARY